MHFFLLEFKNWYLSQCKKKKMKFRFSGVNSYKEIKLKSKNTLFDTQNRNHNQWKYNKCRYFKRNLISKIICTKWKLNPLFFKQLKLMI